MPPGRLTACPSPYRTFTEEVGGPNHGKERIVVDESFMYDSCMVLESFMNGS